MVPPTARDRLMGRRKRKGSSATLGQFATRLGWFPCSSESFEIGVDGGLLRGSVVGRGGAVLLHGGPGLPWTYMQALVDEICDGYRVAVYQQRGLPPSTAGAPLRRAQPGYGRRGGA